MSFFLYVYTLFGAFFVRVTLLVLMGHLGVARALFVRNGLPRRSNVRHQFARRLVRRLVCNAFANVAHEERIRTTRTLDFLRWDIVTHLLLVTLLVGFGLLDVLGFIRDFFPQLSDAPTLLGQSHLLVRLLQNLALLTREIQERSHGALRAGGVTLAFSLLGTYHFLQCRGLYIVFL